MMDSVAEPKVRVAWSPRGNPAQMRLLKCQVFEIFFGGARGGGKTDGVLGEFGAHASRYGKDAIGLMVRRTRAELVETVERSRELYGPLGWTLNETEKMWRAPDGARLRFAYLERDADADMYQGHNYTRVYVEEVGNFPSPAPVMKLMATLRSGAGVGAMADEPKVRVAWSPRGNPAQMRLLKCQVFEIFFGGARGGGKTDGVLGEFAAHASRYGKTAIGLMVGRTRAELVETIERSREIYGPLGWTLSETEKMWRAPDGARLRFAYLERDADADMYQGHNYTRVYVEEVGNFPSPAPVMKLMATLRS